MSKKTIKGETPLPLGTKLRYGAYLPHITSDNGIYSLTFRLADSLPQSVVIAWRQERDEIIAKAAELGQELTKAEDDRLKRLFSERVENYLDAGAGECWMKNPAIADLVESALKHFDQERYELLCWCVMPNHVHVVVQPHPALTTPCIGAKRYRAFMEVLHRPPGKQTTATIQRLLAAGTL